MELAPIASSLVCLGVVGVLTGRRSTGFMWRFSAFSGVTSSQDAYKILRCLVGDFFDAETFVQNMRDSGRMSHGLGPKLRDVFPLLCRFDHNSYFKKPYRPSVVIIFVEWDQ